jgi:iron donor protein CyaY
MTERPGNEPGSALFARIRRMVDECGVDIRQTSNGNALRLEFADGQRIIVNFDTQTQKVWLAARSGGKEFAHRDDAWLAHDRSEFFARLNELIDQTIASNPFNRRAPTARHAPPQPHIHYQAKEYHGLRNTLVVVLAAALGFWAALRLNQPLDTPDIRRTAPVQTAATPYTPGDKRQCAGTFPANGTVTVFNSGMRTDGPNDPEITLKNDHAHPLLFILAESGTVIPALSVLVHAKQSAALHLPAGQYDMMFGTGSAWCNPKNGFSDGHIVKFDKPLTVRMDHPMPLLMQSSGAGMDDFQLFVQTVAAQEPAPPQPTYSGSGTMEVPRQPNGHFYLPGTVAGVPVTFMVDTGASVTSISSDIARQAGIHDCRKVQFQTANGAATGCIALVPRMTLGNFELQNITVAVMPNMETNLLGANVLRNFQMSQSDSGMLIGPN